MPTISINIRLLVVILLVLVMLGIGVFFLHRFQVGRQGEYFLQQAKEDRADSAKADAPAEKLALLERAVGNYRQYLRSKPDDVDVMAELAQMLIDGGLELFKLGDTGNGGAAIQNGLTQMEAVLRQDQGPEQQKRRRAIIEALVTVGRFNDALAHLALLCETPEKVDGLRALFDKEDLWHRLAAPGTAAEEQPRDARALAGLLKIDGETVDRDKLMALLDDDFWILLTDPSLLLACGQCWNGLQKPEAAIAPLERSILLTPGRLSTYQELAILLRSQKRATDADYYMDLLVRSNPDSYRARIMRSVYRQAIVASVPPDKAMPLAQGAVADAVGAIRMAVEQILEKAQRSADTSPTTADLAKAFDRLPKAGALLTPEHGAALLDAARKAKAADVVAKDVKEETEGLRDALIVATRASMIARRAAKNDPAGQPEVARGFALAAVELFPDDPTVYLTLAHVEQRDGRTQAALDWLRRARERTHDDKSVLWQLAGMLIDSGKSDEAEEILAILKRDNSPRTQTFIAHCQAMIQFSRGNWLAASKGFEKVLPDLTNYYPEEARRANLWLGECYGHLGRLQDQRDAYLRAASTDQTWVPALIGMAQAKAEAGQLDQAIEDYQLLLRLENAPPDSWIRLAELMLAKNLQLPDAEREWTPVRQVIDHAEKLLPDATAIPVLRAKVLAASNAVGDALKLLDATRARLRQEAKSLRDQRASVLREAESFSGAAKQAKLAEADRLAGEARAKDAAQPYLWQAAARLLQRQNDQGVFEKSLAEAEREFGDCAVVRLTKAENLVLRRPVSAGPQLRPLAENTDAFSAPQRIDLWRKLAYYSFLVGDNEQTETLCNRVLENQPGSVDMQQLRFQVAARKGDDRAMERILDELRKQEQTPSAFQHFAEAYCRFRQAGSAAKAEPLNQARAAVANALRLNPRSAEYRNLAAMIHERLGNQDAALENFMLAVEYGVRDPLTIRHVARLLAARERFTEADRLFRMLGESQVDLTGQVERERGAVKFHLGEYRDSLDLARKVAAKSEKSADQIWLGQLLSIVAKQEKSRGQNEEADKLSAEAEAAFRDAVLRDMDKPETWVALIHFYEQAGRKKDAEATLDWARRKLSPDRAAAALAQCYEALGRMDDAAKQYELAVTRAPNDVEVARRAAAFYFGTNRNAEGEALLNRILSGQIDATPAQQTATRQMMAQVLLTRGGKENFDKANGYVEQNLQADPSSVTDQLLKSVILVSRGGETDRTEAIRSLEDYLQTQRRPSPEIQFRLAMLYLADEELWDKYKPLMRSLLQSNQRDVRYLASYVDSLLRHQELNEAKGQLDKLVALAPDALVTAVLRADYAFRGQQYDTAVKTLVDWLDNPKADVANRSERLRLVGEKLGEFARQAKIANQTAAIRLFAAEAERIYQQFVDTQPGKALAMAQFFVRQGRVEDALARIERDWKTADPNLVAEACFSVVNGTEATPQQIGRVDQVLGEAIQRHPQAPVLQIALAALRDRQGNLADAERIYRRLLQLDANNVTALNNLATLLGQNRTQLDEAAALIDRALKLVGPQASFLDTRAVIRLGQNKPKEALEDLALALRLEPTAVRYFHQAQAHHLAGQKKSAVDALRKAHELGLTEESLSPSERRDYRRLKLALK